MLTSYKTVPVTVIVSPWIRRVCLPALLIAGQAGFVVRHCIIGGLLAMTVSGFALPDQTEIAIGREVDARLKQKNGVFKHQEVEAYIEHVGLKLASVSERQDIVYHFTILDSDAVNAISAPGGHVYLTRGLLARINNEAQLAAAISHQIAHIARRHGIDRIEKDMKLKTVSGTPTAHSGFRSARIFVDYGFGNKLETDADLKATQYLMLAGYDPQAMIGFLDIIQVEEKIHPRLTKAVLFSHPKTTKRIDMARSMLDNLKKADPKKFESVTGNYYPEKYKKSVLDILTGTK